jgi:Zn-dependent protease
MFQMRRILDPLSPNPQFINLIHRVALGALAGMILAWFMAPDTRFGEDVGTIGFGLFSFAFLFGFSIDVFFTLLDEFVAFADATVRKLGSSGRLREDESALPARPAAQQAPPANPS